MVRPVDEPELTEEDEIPATEEFMTARDELYEIAELLREADEVEKEAKERKEQVRGPFFDLISEVVREEVALAREVVTVEVTDGFDPEAWRKFNYPTHEIVGIDFRQDDDDVQWADITIAESDQFKKFEFTHDGYKYGRTVRMDGKGFEIEKFALMLDTEVMGIDRSIYEALRSTFTVRSMPVYDFDEAKAAEVMAEYPETVAIFQQFINPGTPKVALLPIKPVKEEE